ncbi:MAG: hypothetical protein AB1554_03020 [Chloroflexota bacterium]
MSLEEVLEMVYWLVGGLEARWVGQSLQWARPPAWRLARTR